jgi:hypothetical protein
LHNAVSVARGTSSKKPTPKWAVNDKILRSKGLKHLLFDVLASREERVLRELMALRRDLQTTKFVRVSDHSGFAQIKARPRDHITQRTVSRIEFVTAPSEFATTIDMTEEHGQRRRERALTRELAEIDAQWQARDRALKRGRLH